MLKCVANQIRDVIALLEAPDGDLKIKVYKEPKIKPPRRQAPTQNVTNRSDYMQSYMKDYRNKGKDYQTLSPELKRRRREQRKRQKEKLKSQKPMMASLVDQELTMWQRLGQVIDHREFDLICDRRGFGEEERLLLTEDLCDLNLILF